MKAQYVVLPSAKVPVRAGQFFSLSSKLDPSTKDNFKALVDFDMVEEALKAGVDLHKPGTPTDNARANMSIAAHLVHSGLAEIVDKPSKNKQTH
ncbi:hypothetical protein PA10_00209 [Pseudomonas phage pPa_SNUABM_DT01]|nr:hypothetical protein PA10_00209 [Pseudomonas phage pPa_SNUABM_DT01]